MRICQAWIVLFVAATLSFSQAVNGTISGTVSDVTSAPISGATVTVTNAATHVVAWTGKTNSSGVYRAPDLPASTYDVAVTASGFERQRVAGVHLAVDQTADVNVTLAVGQVSQEVTVSGSVEGQLQTDTASLGQTITPSQVQNLPLPSRDTLNLLALAPGVSSGGDITNQGGLNAISFRSTEAAR